MPDRLRCIELTLEPETLERAAGDTSPETFRATVITEANVDGYVIRAAGVDVGAYMKHPVVLFGHDRSQPPIGTCTRMWRDGTKWLATFTLAGTQRGQELAQLIREKVLRAVSVCGSVTQVGGVQFDAAQNPIAREVTGFAVEEFSLVSLPADGNALIARSLLPVAPAAPGLPEPSARLRTIPGLKAMAIGVEITRMKAAHQAALDAANTLHELASSEERPLSEQDRTTYNAHLDTAEALATQITDAERLERASQIRARPVNAPAIIRPEVPKLDKGIRFARMAMAIASARGNFYEAAEVSKRWRDSSPEVEQLIRAAVAAGTTATPAWAGALVPTAQHLGSELIELLFPASVLGQINLRSVPFNVAVPRVTGGATANWVGEGKLKPVSAAAFDKVTLGFNKLAVIAVLTEELVRFSDPSAEATVRDLLVEAVRQAMDSTFVSTAAAVIGVKPAGILNGVTPTVASGGTPEDISADIVGVLGKFMAAGVPINNLVAVMNPLLAMWMGQLRLINGEPAFGGLSMSGGSLMGIPVVTSQHVGVSAGEDPAPDTSQIIFIAQDSILLARDPAMRIDSSREATVEMSSDPEADTGTMVGLWQSNMVGLLVEQFITWTPARPGAVQVLTTLPVAPLAIAA